jgi:PAS domain S-box-containing protein
MANKSSPSDGKAKKSPRRLAQVEHVKFEWESAVDSVPQLICVLHADGRVVRSNRTAEKWGLGAVNLVSGRMMHELMHPACNEQNCYFNKILDLSKKILTSGSGIGYRVHDAFLKRNVHIQLNPFEVDDQDENGHLVLTVNDIGELNLDAISARDDVFWSIKEQSEIDGLAAVTKNRDFETQDFKLIENVKKEWESAVDSLPQIICLVDKRGEIIRANRAIEQWKLGRVKSVKGRSLHDMLHANCKGHECCLAGLNMLISDVGKSGKVAEFQGFDNALNRHLHFQINNHSSRHDPSDGQVVVLVSDISDIKRAELEIDHLNNLLEKRAEVKSLALKKANFKLKQEIEARKWAEHELLLRRQEYQTLVDTMNEGMIIQDLDRKVIYVNRRMVKILGYPRNQIVGKHLTDFIDADNLDGWTEEKLASIKGANAAYEVRLKTKNNTFVWVKVSPQPRYDADGKHIGSFSVITNINEHVELEQKLLKTEVQLRSLSRQVLSAQEGERRRIALELHDGIGQTLSAIKFFVENNLSAMTQESGIQNTKIEMVVPKLQGAIEEVRRISMDLRPSLLDDIGIIATLSWFCREQQQTYLNIVFGLDIASVQETDIPKELKTEMFRIVQEAVNNACKYSGAKNIQISLKKDGKHIHLWVKDDGKGFDYQKIADLQGYSESKGLGLTGMRERTESSGGWFSVTSSIDTGTAVACMWPIHSLSASIFDRRTVNDRRTRSR